MGESRIYKVINKMKNLLKIIKNFKNKRVLIIGDLILDCYVEGDVSRISPEAPVPVLNIKKESYVLGGAGNVASNISNLGGKAVLFSFVGEDSKLNLLKNLLNKKNIKSFLMKTKKPTIQKTRIISGNQQIIRVDNEQKFNETLKEETKKSLLNESQKADIIIISDYAKGTITKDLMDFLSPFKEKIIIDPKPSNKNIYNKALLMTPNEKESLLLSGEKKIKSAGKKLREKYASNILITLGKKGMELFSDKQLSIPTYAKEVYDVSGAGDTVISSLALSLSTGANLADSAIIANYAAGIVVEKKGTYSLSYKELKNRISSRTEKIKELNSLKSEINTLKKKNKKIVWTNGCFDLLHIGHIRYLKKAKKKGDILILGLNSDSSVKKIKGEDRPIQTQDERAEILSSLEFIDYILIFNDETPEKYLKELKPDVYVKGGDYDLNTINQKEKKIIEGYGGKIKLISLESNKSTTKIINKIRSLNNNK